MKQGFCIAPASYLFILLSWIASTSIASESSIVWRSELSGEGVQLDAEEYFSGLSEEERFLETATWGTREATVEDTEDGELEPMPRRRGQERGQPTRTASLATRDLRGRMMMNGIMRARRRYWRQYGKGNGKGRAPCGIYWWQPPCEDSPVSPPVEPPTANRQTFRPTPSPSTNQITFA